MSAQPWLPGDGSCAWLAVSSGCRPPPRPWEASGGPSSGKTEVGGGSPSAVGGPCLRQAAAVPGREARLALWAVDTTGVSVARAEISDLLGRASTRTLGFQPGDSPRAVRLSSCLHSGFPRGSCSVWCFVSCLRNGDAGTCGPDSGDIRGRAESEEDRRPHLQVGGESSKALMYLRDKSQYQTLMLQSWGTRAGATSPLGG